MGYLRSPEVETLSFLVTFRSNYFKVFLAGKQHSTLQMVELLQTVVHVQSHLFITSVLTDIGCRLHNALILTFSSLLTNVSIDMSLGMSIISFSPTRS